MAFDLSSIRAAQQHAPRIVLYGVPGIGKTTLAAEAPSPIFLPVETGLGLLDVPTFPQPESYEDVVEAMSTLLTEEHEFETLVIDGLDKLEAMVWEHVCEVVPHEKGHKVKRIEDYGYGKGYTHAVGVWRQLTRGLDALSESGMTVILIAHSNIYRFDAPDSDPYDRYQLRLHSSKTQNAEGIITDWCDALLFLNYRTSVIGEDRKRAVGKGERIIHTQERPAFKAKNRFRMPAELKLPEDDPAGCWAELASYLYRSKA